MIVTFVATGAPASVSVAASEVGVERGAVGAAGEVGLDDERVAVAARRGRGERGRVAVGERDLGDLEPANGSLGPAMKALRGLSSSLTRRSPTRIE